MAYTTLYRKFRPQVFEDVYGQDHIVTALRNQIVSDRIGHAYIFSGTRGTGKTTIAKIFAKAINCEHPVNGSPCGECFSCKQIADNAALNVIEIDGASNNGIDNIRDIIDEVSYPPMNGKYKVYIIDEAHAVTKEAFNALLKTLEEPPSYVVFILATTESGQLLNTIRSRCQQYDFHRISLPMIKDRLAHVIHEEGLQADDKSIRYMARMADGSLRDGISLLDQCIAFSNGDSLKYDNVLQILGAVDTTVFSRLIRYVYQTDAANALRVVDEMISDGREPMVFASDLVWYLRNLLLVKSGEDLENILDISTENQKLLAEEAAMISEDVLIRYIRVLSEAIAQLRYSPVKRVTLEVAIVRLCRPQMEQDLSSLIHRLEVLEQALKGNVVLDPSLQVKSSTPTEEKTPFVKEIKADTPPSVAEAPVHDVLTEEAENHKDIAVPTENMATDKEQPFYWSQVEFEDPTISIGLESTRIVFEADDQITIYFDMNDPMQSILKLELSESATFAAFKASIQKAAGKDVTVTLKEGVVAQESPQSSREQSMTKSMEQLEQVLGKKIETEEFN